MRVRPPSIIEVQIPANRRPGLSNGVVGPDVDLLVFHRSPKPLDEYIVPPSALTVHADCDLVVQQKTRERLAGELAALIRIEDVGLAVSRQRLFHRLDTEIRLQCDR